MLHVLILLLLTFAGGTWGGTWGGKGDFVNKARKTWEAVEAALPWKLGNLIVPLLYFSTSQDWGAESPWVDGVKCWGTKDEMTQRCRIEKTCINGAFTKSGGFYGKYYCCYNQETL